MRIAFASDMSTAQPKRAMLEAVTKDNFLCDVESLCSSSELSPEESKAQTRGKQRRRRQCVRRRLT